MPVTKFDSSLQFLVPPDVLALFGEPPLLGGEDDGSYNTLMERFAELVEPNDMMEWWWVKDLTDHAWEIRRLRRFKVWFFEIQYEKTREFEAILSVGREANKSVPAPDEKKWAEVLIGQPDKYANIDKLISSAESRRNRTLREIERHRSDLARRLRQASEDAVDDKGAEPLKKAA